MPNHVYCNISVEEKYADKLKEIAEVGLCRYYKPMPEELDVHKYYDKTHDNPYGDDWGRFQKEQKEWIIKQKASNLKRYGSEDWYDWCIFNWGTKWGCYDNEYEDGHYRFTTAWNPLATEILDMLAKDIPDFCYDWEEEQGYGQEIEYTDGDGAVLLDYDIPNWEDTDNDEIYFLAEDYESPQGYFKTGYYMDGFLDSFLAETYEEALKEL